MIITSIYTAFLCVLISLTSISALPKSNLTLPIPNAEIFCYEPTDVFHPHRTSFDACRPIFQTIRSFPYFNRPQIFEWEKRPIIPAPWPRDQDKPPFAIPSSGPDGRCVLHLAPFLVTITDRFSWKNVKDLGQEILQTCEQYGYGGRTRVGDDERWAIRVFGYSSTSEYTNTTQTENPSLPNVVRIGPSTGDAV